MSKVFVSKEFGYQVEIGKYARQADGAVWFKQGGTVLLATVSQAPSKEFPGFLPLTIDYREHFSAVGKIPGGYYKREGKATDKEVLTGRLVDRALRPLFPVNFFNQVQIIVTVYSVDKEHQPNTVALLASSLVLSISSIPFMGPVGVVEVGRINNQWVFNPTYSQTLESDVKIIIAGTQEGINMVEGSANKITEAELLDVLFLGHEIIKNQVAWQESIQKEVSKPKEPIINPLDWDLWTSRIEEFLTQNAVKTTFLPDKLDRAEARKRLEEEFFYNYQQEIVDQQIQKEILEYIFDNILKQKIADLIIALGKRIDGRAFDEVRTISTEVGLLPFTHGSALFTRGRTQALATLTLGGGQDEQKVEDLMGNTIEKSFMLHYNFLPFSTGEVRPMRAPSRREVGHGYLATSALQAILPSKEEFPYTIRLVTDILESDGSTSMATVCSSMMALMNGGVPIKQMVSGVAMGLIGSKGIFQAITDINGIEDEFGLMDFKVAGTFDGITAIQMDIKYKGGLSRFVFEQALEQARVGRDYILKQMQKVMSAPNPKLSELVPQIVSFKVPTDKIGAIIGTGGKTIKEIIEKTDTMIDIEEDGLVKIYGHPGPKLDLAVNWVKVLGGKIEQGSHYTGKIKRLAEFGIFVELVPGLDGLVHISTIPKAKQAHLAQDYKVGQIVEVEVLDYDETTGRIRLKILEKK